MILSALQLIFSKFAKYPLYNIHFGTALQRWEKSYGRDKKQKVKDSEVLPGCLKEDHFCPFLGDWKE